MIYKFRIISNESEDFVLDIAVSGNSTFLQVHQFIQKALKYDPMQLASFFITDHEWNKEIEITLVDMMVEGQSEILEMEKAVVEDFIADSKQRMLYLFDMFSERGFFMEVFEIERGTLDNIEVLTLEGTPPQQIELELLGLNGVSADDQFEMEEELDDFYSFDEDGGDDFNEIADEDYY